MHSDEWMDDAGVKLQVTSFFHTDLEAKLLLVRLLEFLFKLQHHGDVLDDLGWGFSLLTAVKRQSESISHRVL